MESGRCDSVVIPGEASRAAGPRPRTQQSQSWGQAQSVGVERGGMREEGRGRPVGNFKGEHVEGQEIESRKQVRQGWCPRNQTGERILFGRLELGT